MTAFHITLLQPAHLPSVAELELLCFAQPWSETALSILTRSGGFGIVALTDDFRLVGYGGMVTVLDEGQITNIAVHPEFRRLGVGREILSALIAHAESHGIAQISLEVRVSNHAARELYLQQEFRVEGTRRRFYSHPVEDGLVMVRYTPTALL